MRVVSPPLLFATDLDGTLLPNGPLASATGCLERTQRLLSLLRASGSPIVYSSGRHLELAREAQREFHLPLPDHWVCNVGSEIYDLHGTPDIRWREQLGHPFERIAMLSALADIEQLQPQESERHGPHKISFYYPTELPDELILQVAQRLGELRAGLRLIHSVEESSGRGLLDVLPDGAGKAPAMAYLSSRHGLHQNEVFFSGDSGNDLDALMSGVCATLVGNAPESVRAIARQMQESTPEANCYFATEFYGDGIAQGLSHFGLITYIED